MLREAAVTSTLVYDEEMQCIETTVASRFPCRHSRHNLNFLSPHQSPPVNASLLYYGPGSIAEQMIVSYQPGGNPKPLVTKVDGHQYPKNPDNGYVSRHPIIFRGCLGCEKIDHLFKTCSQYMNTDVRANYWQELWSHMPVTRMSNTMMRDDRLSRDNNNNDPAMHMTTHQSSSGSLGRGQGVNTPSWMSN